MAEYIKNNQFEENLDIDILIEEYKSQGIDLWVENKNLKFKAPSKVMTSEKIKEIKKNKAEIIKYLSNNCLKQIDDENGFGLTPIQQAYLSGRDEAFELGGISANYYFEIQYKSLNTAKFEKAFNEVVKHNDALRTVVFSNGTQKVLDNAPYYKINTVKVYSEEEIMNLRNKWSKHIYDLGKWPMFKVNFTTINENDYRIHVSFDCIVLDAWSVKIMLTQVFKIYNDEEVLWPNYTFKEYCMDFLKHKNEKAIQKADEYWTSRIDKIPSAPKLPYKCHLSEIKKPDFKRIHCKLTKTETNLLYLKAKKYRITPAAVICTVYMKTLSEFSKEKDLTLNLTVLNRAPINKDVQNILGDFTNISLASYIYNENKTFYQEVMDTQGEFWNLVKYRDYSGLELIRKLSKDKPSEAIMPVVFTGVLQGLRSVIKHLPSNAEEVYAYSQTPQVSLDFQATDFTGELSMNWDYVQNAFDKNKVEEMFNATVKFLKMLSMEESWDQCMKVN